MTVRQTESREMVNSNTHRDHLLEAAGLRVRFFWQGDRFAHDVWISSGADWLRVLVSVEGSADDAWPPSPPFQSLHVDQRDDGRRVALLVGMAGKSHWSASAEIDPRRACVNFDVACRVHDEQAGPLSSAYHDELAGGDADRPLVFEICDQLGPAQLERAGEVLKVAASTSPAAPPKTIRWGYRIATVRPP